MERTRNKKITRGVLLFAFNSSKYEYTKMAEYNAKRVHAFLGLPTTLITDSKSKKSLKTPDVFDKIKVIKADPNNKKDGVPWLNKGRYQAYALSPYDETLLLDVDYIINSDKLLKTFDFSDSFCCHNETEILMWPGAPQESLSSYSYNSLWATVIMFKKSDRAKQIFDVMRMVQENYAHYANIHNFVNGVFRNDYALTLALKIVNGHTNNPSDFIPWRLVHIGKDSSIYADKADCSIPEATPAYKYIDFNTNFTVMFDHWKNSKLRKEYIKIQDMDFHIINKDLFENICDE